MISNPVTVIALVAALLCGGVPTPSGAVEYDYTRAPGDLVVAQLGMSAAEIAGATLYNDQGEGVGEIDAVLVGPQGQLAGIGVKVGGFLGIGARDVMLHLDQLHRRGDRLVTLLSRAQLEAQPEWDG